MYNSLNASAINGNYDDDFFPHDTKTENNIADVWCIIYVKLSKNRRNALKFPSLIFFSTNLQLALK